MDHQSLTNVLGILRLIKSDGTGKATTDLIRGWIGGPLASPSVILKVAAYVQEQISDAKTVIEHSQLSDEAKQGVEMTLVGLEKAFSLSHLTSAPNSHVQNIPGSISNFVILLSVTQSEEQEIPSDVEELLQEIKEVLSGFEDGELDPLVRDTAKRHLKILSTLLQHIPIFGVEAALTTYFELMLRVRRADTGASKAAKSKMEPLWEKMEKWGVRLTSLDKLWNAGARLLRLGGKAGKLLEYLPDNLP